MKRLLTTFALYDGYKLQMYEQYIRPRFVKYAELHNLEFREFNNNNFTIEKLHPEIDEKENLHFNRWLTFKKLIDSGELTDGDIIYNFDADIFIKDYSGYFIPEKSFTYAIDSGNTHCFGFFTIKVSDFSRKLIDNIVSRDRWLSLREYEFYNEHDARVERIHIADQQMFQTCAGIKPHSWQSFFEISNLGWHSYVTEHTLFSLDDLRANVQVLPQEWNTTHLLEETGYGNARNTYDINHTTRDKVIFRHFAGGQPWRFAEWEQEFGK